MQPTTDDFLLLVAPEAATGRPEPEMHGLKSPTVLKPLAGMAGGFISRRFQGFHGE